MSSRCQRLLAGVAVVAVCAWFKPAVSGVAAQAAKPAPPPAYSGPRTSDGKPDLKRHLAGAQLGALGPRGAFARGRRAGRPGRGRGRRRSRISRGRWRRRRRTTHNRATADPLSKCYLPGVPRITYVPLPFEITQTPKYVVMAYEYRPCPPHHLHGRQPARRSARVLDGRLARQVGGRHARRVDTNNFTDKTWFDKAGNFHSTALQVIERYTPDGPQSHQLRGDDRRPEGVHAAVEDEHAHLPPARTENLQLLDYDCVSFFWKRALTSRSERAVNGGTCDADRVKRGGVNVDSNHAVTTLRCWRSPSPCSVLALRRRASARRPRRPRSAASRGEHVRTRRRDARSGEPDISGMYEPGYIEQPAEMPVGGTLEADRPRRRCHRPDRFRRARSGRQRRLARSRSSRSRQPMIVDPPDGKIPMQPWVAERSARRSYDNQDKAEYLDPRVRCLQAGVPRANTPVYYNSYQILQKPGYVVIVYEWNHMTRIIPLDGRPHLDPRIRLPMGDSRGRWEGNSLVVDDDEFQRRHVGPRPWRHRRRPAGEHGDERARHRPQPRTARRGTLHSGRRDTSSVTRRGSRIRRRSRGRSPSRSTPWSAAARTISSSSTRVTKETATAS